MNDELLLLRLINLLVADE